MWPGLNVRIVMNISKVSTAVSVDDRTGIGIKIDDSTGLVSAYGAVVREIQYRERESTVLLGPSLRGCMTRYPFSRTGLYITL